MMKFLSEIAARHDIIKNFNACKTEQIIKIIREFTLKIYTLATSHPNATGFDHPPLSGPPPRASGCLSHPRTPVYRPPSRRRQLAGARCAERARRRDGGGGQGGRLWDRAGGAGAARRRGAELLRGAGGRGRNAAGGRGAGARGSCPRRTEDGRRGGAPKHGLIPCLDSPAQAARAGTIGCGILTSLGPRCERVYLGTP